MKIYIKIFLLFLVTTTIYSVQAAGAKFIGKALDETLELAAKCSGRTLSKLTKFSLKRSLIKMTSKYGDDILPLVRQGGLEVLEQGAKHGDDFWRLCKQVPTASRSLALHADELLPLAKRLGPEVLQIEARTPGLATRIVREFGDDGIRQLAKQSPQDLPKLLGYAGKADSSATKKLLLNSYVQSKNPSAFLNALNWKQIMAGGLSAAAIVTAYKVSNGVAKSLENPAVAEKVMDNLTLPLRWGTGGILALLLLWIAVRLNWRKKRKQA